MRKWMSDRLKRRKKGGEAAKDQAKTNAPEPLQPKYFESDIDDKAGASAADTARATVAEASTPEPPASEPSSSERSALERLSSERPAQRSSPQRSSGPRSLPQRSPGQRSSGSGITPSSSPTSSSPTSSSHTTSEQPGKERSPADDESSDTGKETQADFLLGSRGVPELPLAAAVSGESQSRNRNQNRPARRRRRGGRGGARRGPGGIADTPLAAGATAGQRQRLTGTGSVETAARSAHVSEDMPLDEPLMPESASGVTPAFPAPVSAEATSTVRSGTAPASLAGGAPAVPAAPPRPSKGTVVLAIGLPGSGKSSWFKRHDIHPLSSDLLRELLFDDAQEQRFQDLVFSNLRSMLKARLIARRPLNYVDATNLTPHDRHSWIKLAKDYGYDVQGLFFDVPLEVCLERHARRGRAVPEDIMRKMAGKLKPPTFEEGFSKITVVRVKQKDAAAG